MSDFFRYRRFFADRLFSLSTFSRRQTFFTIDVFSLTDFFSTPFSVRSDASPRSSKVNFLPLSLSFVVISHQLEAGD